MLTNKQKRFLQKKAHHLKPIFQIGKSGLHEQMILEISDALEARELIKINLLQNTMEETDDAAKVIASEINAEIVQTIGGTMILYKPSVNKPVIELPKR